jgi:hypothetical protein
MPLLVAQDLQKRIALLHWLYVLGVVDAEERRALLGSCVAEQPYLISAEISRNGGEGRVAIPGVNQLDDVSLVTVPPSWDVCYDKYSELVAFVSTENGLEAVVNAGGDYGGGICTLEHL